MQLTRRELDVMAVLWREGSATVGEVKNALVDDLAYPTVLTMLRTLEQKGHVRHVSEGRAFRYHPVLESDDAGTTALTRVLDKVYQGSRELLMTGLLADEKIDADELARLRALVDAKMKELGK